MKGQFAWRMPLVPTDLNRTEIESNDWPVVNELGKAGPALPKILPSISRDRTNRAKEPPLIAANTDQLALGLLPNHWLSPVGIGGWP